MGIETPQILFGKVMHKRLFPKVNAFNYQVYNFALPLAQLSNLPFAYNKPGAVSFYDRDHGHCDGSDLETWARGILADYKIESADGDITLICMPRIFGYVFNPVSFWLCHDQAGDVRAILCEVHNTFSEKHTYICAHKDQRKITKKETMTGQKVFHVSPFMKREGHYVFRFDTKPGQFGAWVDFYDVEGRQKLLTYIVGQLKPMTRSSLRRAFWGYPLMTLKAITLIHWQALRLIFRGIWYIRKPKQNQEKISAVDGL